MHGKIVSIDELGAIADKCKKENKKIVHAHGVFDLLHIGHINHFQHAKKFGDVLFVTVTPDKFVNRGPHRPIFNEQLRAEAIAAISSVDYVTIFAEPYRFRSYSVNKTPYLHQSSREREQNSQTSNFSLEKEQVENMVVRFNFMKIYISVLRH